MARYIDLSQVIEPEMPVYPGDQKPKLTQTRYLEQDGYTDHRLETGMHAGTHIDVPMHMLANDSYVSDFPPERFAGPGLVLDVRGQQTVFWRPEYYQLIHPDSIVLLWSSHDRLYGSQEYYTNHPIVEEEFARRLVRKNVKMLGIDWPSPDKSPFAVHKLLLAENVLILENLTNLHRLPVEGFEVFAFPLNIKADGSLVRAVARVPGNWDVLNASAGGREQAGYPAYYSSGETREATGGEQKCSTRPKF